MSINDPSQPDSWLAGQSQEVQAAIKELRRENAGHRARNKTLEQQLAGGDGAAKDATIKDLKTRLAVQPVAAKHGIDPEIGAFMLRDKLATWDPDGEDAAEQLEDWLSDLAGQKPELKKVNPPTRSGGDNMTGSSQNDGQLFSTAGMSADAIARAHAAGRFDAWMGRKR